jgi:type IV pilus assembly protein PilB
VQHPPELLNVSPRTRIVAEARAWIGTPYRHQGSLKGVGCDTCNTTGYKGRVGLYEVMEIGEELKELILVGASGLELRRKAVDEGMLTLRASGLRKVKDGLTSIEEVVRETVK